MGLCCSASKWNGVDEIKMDESSLGLTRARDLLFRYFLSLFSSLLT